MKQACIIFLFFLVSCYKEDDYQPEKVDYESLLTLTISASSAPADGVSFIYVIAELPVDVRDDKSSIVFTTDRGLFENGQKTMTKSATMQYYNGANRRIAKIKLTSGKTIETAHIEATIGNSTKATEVNFEPINFDALSTVSFSRVRIPADGASSCVITVQQPLDLPEEYFPVSFAVTKGAFENGQKTIIKNSTLVDEGGVLVRKSVVRLTGIVKVDSTVVEITVKGWSTQRMVYFDRAFPDSAKITASALTIAPGYDKSVSLTTALYRTIGIPSNGTVAEIKVYNSDGNEVGYFLNYANKSDDNGLIQNKYTLGDQNFHGLLKVLIIARKENGEQIRDSIQLISP